jgi:adenylylsulfate kinase-like enzyme
MIDWISKKHREKKRRETHECQLKKSLAEKISQYEQSRSISNDNSPEDEFTEVFIDGKNLRVAKEQITIKGD